MVTMKNYMQQCIFSQITLTDLTQTINQYNKNKKDFIQVGVMLAFTILMSSRGISLSLVSTRPIR